ncbi:MAG: hypothetical protein LBT93_03545 [Treponema sp.]|jgi:hypothetical protein|nr:hypothetical protein [Treponema sp.]
MKIYRSPKVLIFGGILLIFTLGAAFFYFRPPVLLVSDGAFDTLYGNRRARGKRIELSLRFFRRAKTISVAENIGPDMLVFAIEEAARTPYCVLFPYWYEEAAGWYASRFPQVPVLLFGGRAREGMEPEGVLFIPTDGTTDLYRAGRYAAFFAKNGGRVLLFQENSISAEEQSAFKDGLQTQGFEGEILFINPGSETSPENVSCVVIIGSAPAFLERNLNIPIILFSWIDPNFTSRGVKVIFDDSPWAMASRAITIISRGEEANSLPSDIIFPGGRIPKTEKEPLRQLKNEIYPNIIQ